MAFSNREDRTLLRVTLTQEGNKRLADGRLNITNIAFSDSEINYSFGSGITYSHGSNVVMAPAYRKGGYGPMNFDGTEPYELTDRNVFTINDVLTAQTPSIGFYSSISGSTNLNNYRINRNLCLATGYTESSFSGSVLGGSPYFNHFFTSGITTPIPSEGLVFIQFQVPAGPVTDSYGPNIGYHSNFFRYTYASGTSLTIVDRPLPRYNVNSVPKPQLLFFYPLSGYSAFYGSGATTVCPIWNMNIFRKTPEIGANHSANGVHFMSSTSIVVQLPDDVVQLVYGSHEIAGQVKFFGLDGLPLCGIIHYTNSYSGSVYGDQFMPRETEIDIPYMLWHRNGSGVNGASLRGGLKLVDANSELHYDVSARTSYTLLKDGTGPGALEVGRVYYELKLIVLTDQELLTALQWKSGRNWTFPPLDVELVSSTSNTVINASGYTGLAKPGKNYYLTYHITSYPVTSTRQYAPCGYIKMIEGKNDDNGDPMYIKCTFPPNSFPFMRSSLSTFSGLSYHCNGVQLLVQEVDAATDEGVLGLDNFSWKLNTNFGVSRYAGQPFLPGSSTIFPASYVNSLELYATQEEYDDAVDFRISTHADGDITQALGLDKALWPGDEEFFFGNIITKSITKRFMKSIDFTLDNSDMNNSFNTTYPGTGSTFISEIVLIGDDNKIVGSAKPNRPIEKNAAITVDLSLKLQY